MNDHPRFRLLAVAAVGAVVFGATLALVGQGPADPRVTAAGLLTAGTLTAALLLMVWARRRTRPGRHRRPARGPAGATSLDVIPLGHGQAAVVWDDPPGPARARPTRPATPAPETAAATDAIWAAVEAAVRGVTAESPPTPTTGARGRPPRRWPGWTGRRPPGAAGPQGGAGPESR